MSELVLTVLGSSPAWPNPGSACSGYLVSAGSVHLLVECGPGVVGRLRAAVEIRDLSAVLISHMHPDHFLDLVPLRGTIKYGRLGDDRPLRVLLPPGGTTALSALGRALDGDDGFWDVFDVGEYDPAAPTSFGALTVSFRRVQHYVPAYAMRIESGRVLTFSSDAAPTDDLVEHARDADALLCEHAIERAEDDSADPAQRGHMTAGEAGEVARRAGAGCLLLTHGKVDPADPDRAARDARSTFGGPVARVCDGDRYVI